MIKIENVEVFGWEAAIRGMRNPMNSWNKSDSARGCCGLICKDCESNSYCTHAGSCFVVGPNDLELMLKLAKLGPVHAKYRRMIVVYLDIVAPLYWWKEFDTYKVGTVSNSCSTMHKIADKEFTLGDFSHEHLNLNNEIEDACVLDPVESYIPMYSLDVLNFTISLLNECRKKFNETKDKKYWWQIIQLLPNSYNQRRTIMLSYEVLAAMNEYRNPHKLDEWPVFCEWNKTLPYSELITGEKTT